MSGLDPTARGSDPPADRNPGAVWLCHGQTAAIRQVSAMLLVGMPHALLLVGPPSVGKTTLAVDIAAAELCLDPDPARRPCRACRGCRLVDNGNHPDVHRLAPEGAGSMIGIDPVRGLVSELALLPVEGGARLAILESAHRMTEDAQNALLKTLEEPPAGVTMILCADDEERLLPTIQSRVNRVRLGTLPIRAIEELLQSRGAADAPLAGRLARLAAGRPGLALAYARAPDAAVIRGELSRSLLDLSSSSRVVRLTRIRELQARAAELATALQPAPADPVAPRATRNRRSRGGAGNVDSAPPAPAQAALERADADAETAGEPPAELAGPAARTSPAARRRAALALLDVWRDLARDLALMDIGDRGAITQPELLEELERVQADLERASAGTFLQHLDRGGLLIEFNANPELILDRLALAWPRPRSTRAA